MSGKSTKAAQQMQRDGIRRIPRWRKVKSIGGATVHIPNAMPWCKGAGCQKRASYWTPTGPCCFGHAVAVANELARARGEL